MSCIIKPEVQKVVFRAERRKSAEVTAVLVGQEHSAAAPLTVWDSQCGHGGGSWQWYYRTRPAKPEEYAEELRRLQLKYAPEYTIKVVRRISRA